MLCRRCFGGYDRVWRTVCNFPMAWIRTLSCVRDGAFNALRMPSEATGTIPRSEISQNQRNRVFCPLLRVFLPFFVRKSRNIGLLWIKVPMFCIESTDVCAREVRCFWLKTRHFICFLPSKNRILRQKVSVFSNIAVFANGCVDIWRLQSMVIWAKFLSGRDAELCQNF